MLPDKLKFHKTLASYFQSKPLYLDDPTRKKPNTRKLVEKPWQQTKGELWDEVTNTLCNLDFIQAKAAAKMTYELVNDFNAALEVIPDNQKTIREEKERQARMDKYSRDLIDCAKGLITKEELEIPESITPWTNEQYNTEIERIKTKPNRADKLNDFKLFLGQEAKNIQDHALEFTHFSTQQAWNYSDIGPVGKEAEKGLTEISKFLILRIPAFRPLWNPIPQVIRTFKGHKDKIYAVSITPDGYWAISASRDKTCILWDMKTGRIAKVLYGHTGEVSAVSITPDGRMAISASSDKTCILWDLKTGKVLKTLNNQNIVFSKVTISFEGEYAICSNIEYCIFWDFDTSRVTRYLEGKYIVGIENISFARNDLRAIIEHPNKSGWPKRPASVVDVKTGQELQIIKGNVNAIYRSIFSFNRERALV